jgi:hypothetical protein
MHGRLGHIDRERKTEPKQIQQLYEVVLSKLGPVLNLQIELGT